MLILNRYMAYVAINTEVLDLLGVTMDKLSFALTSSASNPPALCEMIFNIWISSPYSEIIKGDGCMSGETTLLAALWAADMGVARRGMAPFGPVKATEFNTADVNESSK